MLAIKFFHQVVTFHHLSEAIDSCGVRPWLQATFLPDDRSEAASPVITWECLRDGLDSPLREQLRVQASIIKYCREMDGSRERSHVSDIAYVLVTDDRFAHGLCLRRRCIVRLEVIEFDIATSEFEA